MGERRQPTWAPGVTGAVGPTTVSVPSGLTADMIMPCDSMPIILRGGSWPQSRCPCRQAPRGLRNSARCRSEWYASPYRHQSGTAAVSSTSSLCCTPEHGQHGCLLSRSPRTNSISLIGSGVQAFSSFAFLVSRSF